MSMATSTMFEPSSAFARATIDLLNMTFIVSAVIFALVFGLVTYCVIRFRGRPGQPEPNQFGGSRNLEIAWTAIPFFIVTWLMVLTVKAMHTSDPPRTDRKPDVIVIGHQFWWEVQYPKSGVTTANEVHIPAGVPLLFRLESADVIHDFWVAPLGRKTDMIPEYPNFAWLESEKPSEYRGTCAEFCGAQHAWMQIRVVAQSPEEFAAWEKQQLEPAPAPTSPSAARGALLFEQMTCVNCHAIRGMPGTAKFAPDLSHLASRKTLGAGVVENTPDGLTRWLKDPQALKPGNLMPNMHLTEAQTTDLVNYFETLK